MIKKMSAKFNAVTLRNEIGVLWVEGEFSAVYTKRGEVISTWKSDFPVKGLQEFNTAVSIMFVELGATTGDYISIAYESSILSHPFLQLPKLSTKKTARFAKRKVTSEKRFDEDAAWSWTEVDGGEGEEHGLLLHNMPKKFLRAVIRICEEFYLTPIRFMPISQVMSPRLMEVSDVDSNGVYMMVALFAEHTEILLARQDGQVLLLRDVGVGCFDSLDRLKMEIERTELYAKQRLSVMIDKVILAGRNASTLAEGYIKESDLYQIEADEDMEIEYSWALRATVIDQASTTNLIPLHIQQRPIRRIAASISMIALLIILLITFATTGWIEASIAARSTMGQTNQEAIAKKKEIEKLKKEIASQQKVEVMAKMLKKANDSIAIPVLLIKSISLSIPDKVWVKLAEAHNPKNRWSLRLRGEAGDSVESGREALALFEKNIADSPLKAHLHESQKIWRKAVNSGDKHSLLKPLMFDVIIRGNNYD